MTIHEIKISPKWYNALSEGKEFEVRRFDRDFRKGDILKLKEWDGTDYTGRTAVVRIVYVLTWKDIPEGIREGYCVLGAELVREVRIWLLR